MTATEIGKTWDDWIRVRAYDSGTLPAPCVGVHYAGTARQGCEYLMPPEMARELARMLTEAADALEGKE